MFWTYSTCRSSRVTFQHICEMSHHAKDDGQSSKPGRQVSAKPRGEPTTKKTRFGETNLRSLAKYQGLPVKPSDHRGCYFGGLSKEQQPI